jgi:hypothetical protein
MAARGVYFEMVMRQMESHSDSVDDFVISSEARA